MAKPLELAFYNPSQLDDECFLLGFVARQDLMAAKEVETILEDDHPHLWTIHRGDFLRLLQFFAELGDGPKLLEWLEHGNLGDRYWPLRVAFRLTCSAKIASSK